MHAARLGVMKGGICVDNIEQEGKDGEEKRKTAPDSTLHPSADAGQKVRLLMGRRRLKCFCSSHSLPTLAFPWCPRMQGGLATEGRGERGSINLRVKQNEVTYGAFRTGTTTIVPFNLSNSCALAAERANIGGYELLEKSSVDRP